MTQQITSQKNYLRDGNIVAHDRYDNITFEI